MSLRHIDVGNELTKTEWEATSSHTVDGGVAGDLLYYDGTTVERIPIGSSGQVLAVVGGVPTWSASSVLVGPLRLDDGTVGAPAYSWLNASTSGWYRAGANDFRYAVGGADVVRITNNAVVVTSAGFFGWGSSGVSSPDLLLYRDAVDILAQRSSANPQTFRIYNTFTDAANFERWELSWSTNVALLQTTQAGTGSSRELSVRTVGGAPISFYTTNTGRWYIDGGAGHFLAVADNTYDIGAAGATRPRTVYAGTNMIASQFGTSTAAAVNFMMNGSNRWSIDTSGHWQPAADNTYDIGAAATAVRTLYVDTSIVLTGDAILLRDAANVLAQRNGVTGQAFRVYNTFTDASNHEYLGIAWGGNVLRLFTNQAGTGAARILEIGTTGSAALEFVTNNAVRWVVEGSTGHLKTNTDNAHDIGGDNANRPRDLHMGRNAHFGDAAARSVTAPTQSINIYNGTAPSGTLTNGATLYVAAGELWVMDAGGTPTQLSPHDPEGYWWFNSKTRDGKKLQIDVEKILRYVNDKYGLNMVRELEEAGV